AGGEVRAARASHGGAAAGGRGSTGVRGGRAAVGRVGAGRSTRGRPAPGRVGTGRPTRRRPGVGSGGSLLGPAGIVRVGGGWRAAAGRSGGGGGVLVAHRPEGDRVVRSPHHVFVEGPPWEAVPRGGGVPHRAGPGRHREVVRQGCDEAGSCAY